MLYRLDDLAGDCGVRLPRVPGVYVFRAADGRALYVGKSRNLHDRLRSYTRAGAARRGKVRRLLREAVAVAVEPTGSDLAAMLREIDLVQALDPPLNRHLRRPQRYVYLCIEYTHRYPRILLTATPPAGTPVFGPLSPDDSLAAAVEIVSDALRLRTCADPGAPGAERCLRRQVGTCSAPCTGGITPGAYGRNVLRARLALGGAPGHAPLRDLRAERTRLAAASRFEEAARVHRLIEAICTIRRRLLVNRVPRRPVIAVQPGAAPGTVHLWGIAGGTIRAEAVAAVEALPRHLDAIADATCAAGTEPAFIARTELDRCWVLLRWLASDEGRRWSVAVAGVPLAVLRHQVMTRAREALGLFAPRR